jgi:hypothetical protein
MSLPVVNLKSALVNAKGFILQPWITFFQQFVQAPQASMGVTIGSSPFSYVAVEPGLLVASGGTVSGITLTRGSTTVTISGNSVSLEIKDVAEVTYSVAPTLEFFPRY